VGNKIDELKSDLDEMTALRDRMRKERDAANSTVNALSGQLRETLQNKALLEWYLRCRMSGLDVGPMLGETHL